MNLLAAIILDTHARLAAEARGEVLMLEATVAVRRYPREHAVTDSATGENFLLYVLRGEELTALKRRSAGAAEWLDVDRTDPWWAQWADEVAAGAFPEGTGSQRDAAGGRGSSQ